MWRKRISAILAVVFLLGIVIPAPVTAAATAYAPVQYGQDLIKNATYTDIKKSSYAESIVKGTALAILRNYGTNSYKPLSAATKDDVIAALVRAGGQQTAAETEAVSIRTADPYMSAVDAYMMGHLRTAQTMGILDTTEAALLTKVTSKERQSIRTNAYNTIAKKNWKMTSAEFTAMVDARIAQRAYTKEFKVPATREEVAVWIAKGTGLTPIVGDKSVTSSNFSDWKSIKGANLPYVEAVLRAKYMNSTDRKQFLPQQAISRGELASIMNSIITAAPEKAGLGIGYGTIEQVKAIKSNNPQYSKAGAEITILDQDGENQLVVTVDKSAEKTADGRILVASLPVVKNGTIGNESLLAKGQFVEYITAGTNEMQLITIGKYKLIKGTFIDQEGNKTVQFKGDDGKTYELKVTGDSSIQAMGQDITAANIPPGSEGKAIVDGSNIKSLEFDFDPAANILSEASVTINYIDEEGKILSVNEGDSIVAYELAPDYVVLMNGKRVGSSEIAFDTPAELKLVGGKVVEIATETEMPEENPNNTLVIKTAKVRSANDTSMTLSFTDDPLVMETLTVDKNTVMLKSSQPIAVTSLHRGDRVKVYMNSAQNKYISKIELQTNGQVLKGVYKGRIAQVSPGADEITLSDVSKFGYNNWVAKNGYAKFHVNTDATVFQGNQELTATSLKDKIGQYVYMATVDDFGSEEIIKMNLKSGGEDLLPNQKITNITWTESKLSLNNNQNYYFQNGSIIVRDGRLLDKFDLEEMGGVWLVMNRTTMGNADVPVISMDGPNGFTNYRIVQGYLHKVGNDYFTIEQPWLLNGTKWTQNSKDDFTAMLSNDTYIYDGIKDMKRITKDQFIETRYKPYKYTWPNYSDYLANGGTAEVHLDDPFHNSYAKYKDDKRYHEHSKVYVLVDSNNNAQSIIIYAKDKLMYEPVPKTFKERLMSGKLLQVNEANGTLDMDMAAEYIPATDTWRPINATVPQDTDNAAIIKNGVPVKATDLEIGDSLYTISVDGIGILILAE